MLLGSDLTVNNEVVLHNVKCSVIINGLIGISDILLYLIDKL